MCLRVLDLSSEEGCSYEANLLNKRFRQTLFSCLKNTNIRIEIRENCKLDPSLSDEKLLKLVADAVANEADRNEKFTVKKEVNLPAQIEELKLTHAKEMSAMRVDLNEIKTALLSNVKPRAHWDDLEKEKMGVREGIGEAKKVFEGIKKGVQNVR